MWQKTFCRLKAVRQFCWNKKNIKKNIGNEQLYNCTGIFKSLPSDTLASREEKAVVHNKSRERKRESDSSYCIVCR